MRGRHQADERLRNSYSASGYDAGLQQIQRDHPESDNTLTYAKQTESDDF
jgi:hypothetical protein